MDSLHLIFCQFNLTVFLNTAITHDLIDQDLVFELMHQTRRILVNVMSNARDNNYKRKSDRTMTINLIHTFLKVFISKKARFF